MTKKTYLPFEKDLSVLDERVEELLQEQSEKGVSRADEIALLRREMNVRVAEIYRQLTPWQIAQVARHPQRPYTLDYVDAIFDDAHELHGDRHYADDPSIVGCLARLGEHPVMIIGHQKGRDSRERSLRNFGMGRPEGYRKALRLMRLAEKFSLPVFTFIDTPGAYPGIGAEERNQAEAIGRNIMVMSRLRVPVIATVIGEGGSGGALAIAVADRVLMLQYATYSVISPEGCASILWKSADKAERAADALALTAERLRDLGLIDRIVPEPLGGAHRDLRLVASSLKKALIDELRSVLGQDIERLLAERLDRVMRCGVFETRPDPAAAAAPAAEPGQKPAAPSDEPTPAARRSRSGKKAPRASAARSGKASGAAAKKPARARAGKNDAS